MKILSFALVICLLLDFALSRQKSKAVEKGHGKKSEANDHHGNDVTRQIEMFLREHSYELSIRPPHQGALPVTMSLKIESISDISEKNMDLTFTLCMHQQWRDSRLQYHTKDDNYSIVLPSRIVDKLWVPDIYVVGSKSSFIHRTTVNNIVLRLFSNGDVVYRIKMTTTVSCLMRLYNFPLDLESCSLKFQSMGYSSDELLLNWSMGESMEELFLDTKLVTNMPKFRLVHHKFKSLNVSAGVTEKEEMRSQLLINFELQRYLLSCLFQSYFPAMVMVVLAGLGMWIDPNSVPARVALGVTSVLTISTVITGLKGSLPKVSYLTAMDIYLWVCFLFVFSTVLEFCVLNFFMTKRGKKFFEKIASKRRKQILKRQTRRFNMSKSQLQMRTVGSVGSMGSMGSLGSIQKQPFNISTEEEKINTGSHNDQLRRNLVYLRSQSTVTSSDYDDVIGGGGLAGSAPGVRAPALLGNQQCLSFEATSVDAVFRIWYFLSFVVFNIAYWTYYVIVTQHEAEESD